MEEIIKLSEKIINSIYIIYIKINNYINYFIHLYHLILLKKVGLDKRFFIKLSKIDNKINIYLNIIRFLIY